jgi:TolA-binding protein
MIVAIYNMLMTQPRVDSSSGANGISGAAKAPATTDPIAKIQKTVSSIDKKVTALTSNLSELTNSVSEVTNSLSELTTTTQHISETVDILKAISDGNPSNQGDGNPSNQGYGNSTNQGNVDIVDPTAQGGGRRRTRRNRA